MGGTTPRGPHELDTRRRRRLIHRREESVYGPGDQVDTRPIHTLRGEVCMGAHEGQGEARRPIHTLRGEVCMATRKCMGGATPPYTHYEKKCVWPRWPIRHTPHTQNRGKCV